MNQENTAKHNIPCYSMNSRGIICYTISDRIVKVSVNDGSFNVSKELAEKYFSGPLTKLDCSIEDVTALFSNDSRKDITSGVLSLVCNILDPKILLSISGGQNDHTLSCIRLIFGDLFMMNREFTGYLQDIFQKILDESPCKESHGSFVISGTKKEGIIYSDEPGFYEDLRNAWPNIYTELPTIYAKVIKRDIPVECIEYYNTVKMRWPNAYLESKETFEKRMCRIIDSNELENIKKFVGMMQMNIKKWKY